MLSKITFYLQFMIWIVDISLSLTISVCIVQPPWCSGQRTRLGSLRSRVRSQLEPWGNFLEQEIYCTLFLSTQVLNGYHASGHDPALRLPKAPCQQCSLIVKETDHEDHGEYNAVKSAERSEGTESRLKLGILLYFSAFYRVTLKLKNIHSFFILLNFKNMTA